MSSSKTLDEKYSLDPPIRKYFIKISDTPSEPRRKRDDLWIRALKQMEAVRERQEKMKKNGGPNFSLQMEEMDDAVIQEAMIKTLEDICGKIVVCYELKTNVMMLIGGWNAIIKSRL